MWDLIKCFCGDINVVLVVYAGISYLRDSCYKTHRIRFCFFAVVTGPFQADWL